jgi:hypothetical protein
MANAKKKLSKNAKAALKILADSKLLAAKTSTNTNALPSDKPSGIQPKVNVPKKMRPEKKRG